MQKLKMYIKVIEHNNLAHIKNWKRFIDKEKDFDEYQCASYHEDGGCDEWCFQLPDDFITGQGIETNVFFNKNKALISIINELNYINKFDRFLMPENTEKKDGILYPKFRSLNLYQNQQYQHWRRY